MSRVNGENKGYFFGVEYTYSKGLNRNADGTIKHDPKAKKHEETEKEKKLSEIKDTKKPGNNVPPELGRKYTAPYFPVPKLPLTLAELKGQKNTTPVRFDEEAEKMLASADPDVTQEELAKDALLSLSAPLELDEMVDDAIARMDSEDQKNQRREDLRKMVASFFPKDLKPIKFETKSPPLDIEGHGKNVPGPERSKMPDVILDPPKTAEGPSLAKLVANVTKDLKEVPTPEPNFDPMAYTKSDPQNNYPVAIARATIAVKRLDQSKSPVLNKIAGTIFILAYILKKKDEKDPEKEMVLNNLTNLLNETERLEKALKGKHSINKLAAKLNEKGLPGEFKTLAGIISKSQKELEKSERRELVVNYGQTITKKINKFRQLVRRTVKYAGIVSDNPANKLVADLDSKGLLGNGTKVALSRARFEQAVRTGKNFKKYFNEYLDAHAAAQLALKEADSKVAYVKEKTR